MDLVYQARGAWRGWSLEWLRPSLAGSEMLCRCPDYGLCSAKLREMIPPERGLLIVRGVQCKYWQHGRECDSCVFALEAERIDGVVRTLFPLCIWRTQAEAEAAAAMCTGWALDDRWKLWKRGAGRMLRVTV